MSPDLAAATSIYSMSQKIPPWGLVAIFPKRLGIFQPNFMCLLCVPIYARLWIFIQLSATLMNYAILSVTTQFTSCVQNVHHRPKRTLAFSDIFPKKSKFYKPIKRLYLRYLYWIISTVTKLCHIECDHPACVSVDGGHFEHIMVVVLNMAWLRQSCS